MIGRICCSSYEEVKDIVADNPTISPRITISSSDGVTHRPKESSRKRNIAKCLQLSRTTASTGSETATSSHSDSATASSCGGHDPVDDSSSECSTSVPRKKCKGHVSMKPKRKAAQGELVAWLQTAEEARVELAERMHADNMTVMNGLLDVLKQMTNNT